MNRSTYMDSLQKLHCISAVITSDDKYCGVDRLAVLNPRLAGSNPRDINELQAKSSFQYHSITLCSSDKNIKMSLSPLSISVAHLLYIRTK